MLYRLGFLQQRRRYPPSIAMRHTHSDSSPLIPLSTLTTSICSLNLPAHSITAATTTNNNKHTHTHSLCASYPSVVALPPSFTRTCNEVTFLNNHLPICSGTERSLKCVAFAQSEATESKMLPLELPALSYPTALLTYITLSAYELASCHTTQHPQQ